MILDKNKLIEDQKYGVQLVVYSLFMMAGVFFFLISLLIAKGPIKLEILIICMCVTIVPFGMCIGLYNIIKTLKEWNKVQMGNITIVEMKILDMRHKSMSKESRHTTLHFGDGECVFVNAYKAKKYRIGDICYRFYLNTNGNKKKFVGFPYNKKEYVLGEDLAVYLDKKYKQEELDPRYLKE